MSSIPIKKNWVQHVICPIESLPQAQHRLLHGHITNIVRHFRKMTPQEKRIYDQIDSILWNDWDPIGVNEFESARDEYYSYIPEFVKMVFNLTDLKEIADKLTDISTKTMGLPGNRHIDLLIAQKIYELEDQLRFK